MSINRLIDIDIKPSLWIFDLKEKYILITI